MKVHLTGGSGFTGSFVLAELLSRGHEVEALARSADSARRLAAAGAHPVLGDLDGGHEVLAEAFASGGADVLLNVASLGFGHAGMIVAAAQRAGIQRAVFVSTTAIFTRLDAPSKAIRLAAEDAIISSTLAWTIVRPTMIYGTPDDRNMWRLLRFLHRAPAVPLPDGGRNLQQPVHVIDLAKTIVNAMESSEATCVAYDVPGPTPLTFREIVEDASRAVGRFPRIISVPAGPVRRGLAYGERQGLRAPVSAEQIDRVLEDKVFDGQAAVRDLAHAPRPFWLGIAQEADLGRAQLQVDPIRRAARFVRTARLLDPSQVGHRARLRANRLRLERAPSQLEEHWRLVGRGVGWPPAFEPLDAAHGGSGGAERFAERRFAFLGVEHELGEPADWEPDHLPQLWRYHLHYFDWAWSLHRHPDREWARSSFASLWRSWRAGTQFGAWDAWSPYVVALRSWSLCGLFDGLIRGSGVEAAVVQSLGSHAGFLRRNLELDVGGNHLVKNLKALVGLGCFFDDDGLIDEATRLLRDQLPVQVLKDGGHYERSPSYHAQVLGDLLDVERLLAGSGRSGVPGAANAVRRMQRWLGAMTMPDGRLPSFNDSQTVSPEILKCLGVDPVQARLIVLEHSGYVVARPDSETCLIVDVGDPCPPNLPAHAHSDCLSFELAVRGESAMVNAGTSTYAAGAQRQFERSTAAHNTVEIDGSDQTEVWGQFRAGRRARGRLLAASDDGEQIAISGHHDGYRNLPGRPRHRRTFRLQADALDIVDEIEGAGTHLVSARFRWRAAGPALRVDIGGVEQEFVSGQVATGFGAWEAAHCLTARDRLDLPVTWTSTVRWARGEST